MGPLEEDDNILQKGANNIINIVPTTNIARLDNRKVRIFMMHFRIGLYELWLSFLQYAQHIMHQGNVKSYLDIF